MKKILLIISLFVSGYINAQTDGLTYQAVILNPNAIELPGEDYSNSILHDKNIIIRFSIINGLNDSVEYQEIQHTITDHYGMINLIIGKGIPTLGVFHQIFWNGQKKNLKVEIDINGEFKDLSIQEIVFTPYAYHREIIADGILNVNGPVNFYNSLTVDGTALFNDDLVVKGTTTLHKNLSVLNGFPTNLSGNLNVEGLTTLQKDLNVLNGFPTNLSGNLNVEGLTTLQKDLNVLNGFPTNLSGNLNVEGLTTLQKDLNVLNGFPTNLSGNLNVEGLTTLQKDLNVLNGFPTNLSGNLNVEGLTTLLKDLNVLNGFPTNLSGNLNVEGLTTLQKDLNVLNGFPTNLSGNLNVEGLTTLQKDLNVLNGFPTNLSGNLNVEGLTTLQKDLNVLNGFPTNLSGNLNVEGLTTLQKDLNVLNGFPTNLSGNLNVEGLTTLQKDLNVLNGFPTNLSGNLNVEGLTTLQKDLNVLNGFPTNLSGSLNVEGLTTLQKDLNVLNGFPTNLSGNLNVEGLTTLQNKLNVNGKTVINAVLSGTEDNFEAYPLTVSGSNQGIAIQLQAAIPDTTNNFISFLDQSGNAIGAIEGQTAGDVATDAQYIYDTVLLTSTIALDAVKVGLAAIPIVSGGLGAVVGVDAGGLAAETATLVFDTAQLPIYQSFAFSSLGVTYSSGSADYAEWLPRLNANESIEEGDIVGVFGGKISKNTKNTKQFMVVSTKPALLGNVQPKELEPLFEKVAFMGQIPVKVRGLVLVGDYIIPSSLEDGVGIAVSPNDIKLEQYSSIVGVAWSSAFSDLAINKVNLAIGLNHNDMSKVIEKQSDKIKTLENRIDNIEKMLHNGIVKNNIDPIIIEGDNTIKNTKKDLIIKYLPNELNESMIMSIISKLNDNNNTINKIPESLKYQNTFINNIKQKYKEIYNNIIKNL